MEGASDARASGLAALSHLSLLSDDARSLFFPAVAELLLAAPGTAVDASLHDSFGLNFSAAGSDAELLLHATKLLLCRVATREYETDGSKQVHAELLSAGLADGAAVWVREAAEAAVKSCGSAELRLAQAHAAASYSHDYLHDFDWSVYHVLGSSSLARVQTPLLQLHLQIAKAGRSGEVATEALELTPTEVDATLGALSEASEALRALS